MMTATGADVQRPPASTTRAEAGLWLLLGLLAALSLYRALVLHYSGLCLYVDEAQYWTWAKHLDWGYFSKPPMIAALIAATTALFGDGELAVKCGALAIYPLVALLIHAIARRLFDDRIAFWCALAFATLPGVSFSSMIVSTDVPLFLFWCLALYAYLRALDSGSLPWWIAAGVAAGLGLLTKYTMLIFALSALLHLATTPALRTQLRRPGLYLAMLAAVLVFLPNLVWNARHGWPTLHHTTQISGLDSGGGPGIGLHGHELTAFLGGQAAIIGPVLIVAWVLQLSLGWRAWMADTRYRMLACFGLPFLALISAQALFGRANANWAAMSYAAGTIFVVARLVQRRQMGWLYAALGINLFAMGLAYHYDAITRAAGIEMNRKSDLYKRVRGWPELGARTAALLDAHPQALLLGDERDALAELEYYVCLPSDSPGTGCRHPLDAVKWNPRHVIDSHYALTTTMDDKIGRDFIYVSRNAILPEEMAGSFTEAQPLPSPQVTIHADYRLDFHAWLLKDFRGYR